MLKQVLVDRLGKRQDLYAWRVYQAPPQLSDGARICLLHSDGRLGDAVINSVVPTAFKSRYPGIEVWLGTVPNFLDYWSSHPDVKKAIVLKPLSGRGLGRFSAIRAAAKPYRGFFDLVVSFDPFVQLDTFYLLNLLQAGTVVGFSKPQYRLFDYSVADRSFEIEKEHVVHRLEALFRLFDIPEPFRAFPAHLPTSSESEVEAARLLGICDPSGVGDWVRPTSPGSSAFARASADKPTAGLPSSTPPGSEEDRPERESSRLIAREVPKGRHVKAKGVSPCSPDEPDATEPCKGEICPLILLNTYGGGKDKTLTADSVLRLIDLLLSRNADLRVYVSLPTSPLPGWNDSLIGRFGDRVRLLGPAPNLSVLFSTLERVDGIVTPDTAAGHIGAALDKPVLCLFHDIGFGPTVWRPYSERAQIVVSRGGKDVNDQDWSALPRVIDRFLAQVESGEPRSPASA